MDDLLPKNLLSFIWHFLKAYKRVVVLYISLALLAGCWGPFNSMLIKDIINALDSHNTASLISLATLIVLNFIIFDNVTWRSIGYLNYKYNPVIKYRVVNETFHLILGASHQFFNNSLSGRVANHVTTLADNVERILFNTSHDLLRGASMLLIALVSMYFVNPKFFCVLALWFLVFSAFSIYMSKRLVTLADMHAGSESVISGQIVDSFTNSSNIRLFARSSYETSRLQKYLSFATQKFQAQQMFTVLLHASQGALIAIMQGFMIYYLIELYEVHQVTLGDFALIIGLSMEVGHITWYTMSQVDELNKAVGKCKQSLSALIVPRDIMDAKDAVDLVVTKGVVVFEDVGFHYSGITPLFHNKSVSIEAGQKIGLVGYSGSGKSTFVNLILRLYDVTGGRILIDDQDITRVTQDSLRKNIAIIPQDPSLFHRSLMENIRYGKEDATDAEVIEAAKRAHAHEFIIKLQEGYNSMVGERGVKLSGGQRQRIAIARAILKNAPILILDEATSQLDSITEHDIQESLWTLMQDKTTIVVAHRLSTLLHMDRIIVFDKGKIVEAGTHEELLNANGLYKTLWDAQVGGFLPDTI